MEKEKGFIIDRFTFYASFYEAIRTLPPENQGRIYNAIFAFVFEGEEQELDGMDYAVFTLIRPHLVANRARQLNGCKGGRPNGKTENKPDNNRNKTETKPNDNLTETKAEPQVNLRLSSGAQNIIAAKLNNNIINKNSARAREESEDVQASIANYKFICECTGYEPSMVDDVIKAIHDNGYFYDNETLRQELFGTLVDRACKLKPTNLTKYVGKILKEEIEEIKGNVEEFAD